jgi:hypothetical protein
MGTRNSNTHRPIMASNSFLLPFSSSMGIFVCHTSLRCPSHDPRLALRPSAYRHFTLQSSARTKELVRLTAICPVGCSWILFLCLYTCAPQCGRRPNLVPHGTFPVSVLAFRAFSWHFPKRSSTALALQGQINPARPSLAKRFGETEQTWSLTSGSFSLFEIPKQK